jgi:hypothetical protein
MEGDWGSSIPRLQPTFQGRKSLPEKWPVFQLGGKSALARVREALTPATLRSAIHEQERQILTIAVPLGYWSCVMHRDSMARIVVIDCAAAHT